MSFSKGFVDNIVSRSIVTVGISLDKDGFLNKILTTQIKTYRFDISSERATITDDKDNPVASSSYKGFDLPKSIEDYSVYAFKYLDTTPFREAILGGGTFILTDEVSQEFYSCIVEELPDIRIDFIVSRLVYIVAKDKSYIPVMTAEISIYVLGTEDVVKVYYYGGSFYKDKKDLGEEIGTDAEYELLS